MKIIVSDGIGNDEEKEIDTESITGKELLEKLDISVFVAMIMKNNEIVGKMSHSQVMIKLKY